MITVDTAASDTNLTIRTTFKTEANVSGVTDDGFIDSLISQASDAIRKYCGRKFERESITETMPGTGSSRLLVTRTPIVTLTSVTVNGTLVDSDEYTLEDADLGLLLRHDDGTPPAPKPWSTPAYLHMGLSREIVKSSGSNNISVVYVAGYLLPGEGSPTLPSDIERACLDIIKARYLARENDPNIRSQKIGDASETRVAGDGLTVVAKTLLDPWRRITV